jgi:hypothetical protein
MKIRFWLVIIGFMVFASVMSVADESTPLVVIAQAGDLWVWQNGETQIFPVGDLIFPYLSPSGNLVALVRGEYPYPQRLSVISITGDNLRDFDVAYPRQVIWQSENVLWINSYLPHTEGMLELNPSTGLYRVNIETGEITEWDMDEPFTMTINPNREWLSLSFAGVYGESEGQISLLSLFEDIPPVDVVQFEAISSGSHGGYYPPVQWLTDTSARIAIPEPNALYIVGDILPQTQLLEINTDGTTTLLGEINTPLYPTPMWSADGASMAYMTASRDGLALAIASHVGEINHVIIFGESVPFFSIPQSDNFLFIEQNTAMQIVGMNTEISQWVTGGGAWVADLQLYSGGVVLTLLSDDVIRVVYAGWSDNLLHEILKTAEYPFFDAKWD